MDPLFAHHWRWLLALLACSVALLLGLLLIQAQDESNESLVPASLSRADHGSTAAPLQHSQPSSKRVAPLIHPAMPTPLSLVTPSVAESVLDKETSKEDEGTIPDAPPFFYEINLSKVSRLDIDQQVAVQKAFERYITSQGDAYKAGDLTSLREASERIKEELSAEIGPMSVHDMMQAE